MNNVDELIAYALTNPERFSESEKVDELLNLFLSGHPVAALKKLIHSDDENVKSIAAYIISEVGLLGDEILDDTITLLDSDDFSIKFFALESITICSNGQKSDRFIHVIKFLEDEDPDLRISSMELICNSSLEQLEASLQYCKNHNLIEHVSGLELLCSDQMVELNELEKKLTAESPLERKYAAIHAGRQLKTAEELNQAQELTNDPEIDLFLSNLIELVDED